MKSGPIHVNSGTAPDMDNKGSGNASGSKLSPNISASKGAKSTGARYVPIMPLPTAKLNGYDSVLSSSMKPYSPSLTAKTLPSRTLPLIAPSNPSSSRVAARPLQRLHPIAPRPPPITQKPFNTDLNQITTLSAIKQKKKATGTGSKAPSGQGQTVAGKSATDAKPVTKSCKAGTTVKQTSKKNSNQKPIPTILPKPVESNPNIMNPMLLEATIGDINPPPFFSSINPSNLNSATVHSTTLSTSLLPLNDLGINLASLSSPPNSALSPGKSSSAPSPSKTLPTTSYPLFSGKAKPESLTNDHLMDQNLFFSPPSSPLFLSSLSADPMISGLSASQSLLPLQPTLPSHSMLSLGSSLDEFDSDMLLPENLGIKPDTDTFIKPIPTLSPPKQERKSCVKEDKKQIKSEVKATKAKSRTKSKSKCEGIAPASALAKVSKSAEPTSKLPKIDLEASNAFKTGANSCSSSSPSPASTPKSVATSTTTSSPNTKTTTTPSSAASKPVPKPIELENNPDYLALSSALSLLQAQRDRARNDIVQLSKLKAEALINPESFIANLKRTGKIKDAPQMQTIVRTPYIPWEQYGLDNLDTQMLDRQLKKGIVESNHEPFTSVRLFDQFTNQ